MTRYTFGEAIDTDDILEVQGVEYPMNPIGMRAMKRLLTMKNNIKINPDDPESMQITEADLDLATDIVVSAVRPDYREKFREHIEESVPPNLLIGIATAVMKNFSDVDPTQPGSSSGGSSSIGSASTDGASAGELTPTT